MTFRNEHLIMFSVSIHWKGFTWSNSHIKEQNLNIIVLQCYTRDCLSDLFIYLFYLFIYLSIYLFIGTTANYTDSASSSFTCLVENLEMTQEKVTLWNI